MAVTNRAALLFAIAVTAAPRARTSDMPPEQLLAAKVFQRLVAVAEPIADLDWPPRLDIGSGERPQASFRIDPVPTGKPRPLIAVNPALLRLVALDEDTVAFILGHELGHLRHRHERNPSGTYSATQEKDADLFALELMLRAGFSPRAALRRLGELAEFVSTHGTDAAPDKDLPTWSARIAGTLRQHPLWMTTSAWQHGVLFLALEQYEAAEVCFERLVREFPQCAEAWANLGHACLMQYCDWLSVDDLRELDLGHLVSGGFFQRTKHVPLRAANSAQLWWRAVGSLREALRLKPDLAGIRTNLGLGYLVRPDSKDVATATQFLAVALEAAPLEAPERAAFLINLAVADLASGRRAEGLSRLDEAELLVAKMPLARAVGLRRAVIYNRALASGSATVAERERASALFESYLRDADPRSVWWPLAYERYAALCQQLGREPKPRTQLASTAAAKNDRLAIALSGGGSVTIGASIEDVAPRLGAFRASIILARTNLKRWHAASDGLDLIVTDQVLALVLAGPKAPPVPFRGGTLRIGQTRTEIERLFLREGWDRAAPAGWAYSIEFCRALGIGLRFDRDGPDGRVVEIILVQPPEPRVFAE